MVCGWMAWSGLFVFVRHTGRQQAYFGSTTSKHNYPYLGRGRSLNFRVLDFRTVQTSKAAPAAGPFEQLPQLLGHSNCCPMTSKH